MLRVLPKRAIILDERAIVLSDREGGAIVYENATHDFRDFAPTWKKAVVLKTEDEFYSVVDHRLLSTEVVIEIAYFFYDMRRAKRRKDALDF